MAFVGYVYPYLANRTFLQLCFLDFLDRIRGSSASASSSSFHFFPFFFLGVCGVGQGWFGGGRLVISFIEL